MGLSKLIMLCLILTSLMIRIPASTQEKALPYWIVGRAVDEKGNPVSGAEVVINYPSCKGCIDQLIPSTKTLEDGKFGLNTEGLPDKGLKLYIQGPIPEGFYSPFSPTFDVLRHNPRFRGHTLLFRMKGEWKADIGDVVVKVMYAKIKVDLVSVFAGKYQQGQEAARSIRFTLRDSYGKEIYDGSLPESSAFDPTYTFANLALTKGKWIVIFTLLDKTKVIMSRRLLLNISSLGCTTVAFRNSQQQVLKCKEKR